MLARNCGSEGKDTDHSGWVSSRIARTPTGAITEIIDQSGDGLGNSLGTPTCIAVDSLSNVFVGSKNPDMLFRITPSGQIDMYLDYIASGIGAWCSPGEIATDALGNVFVLCYSSDKVFKVTPTKVVIELIDMYGDGSAHLGYPHDVDVDILGSVYVPGYNSDNVFRIDFLPTGVGYCLGEAGSGTPCPCSNDNDGSLPGAGCANGVFVSGARLSALGTASLSADDVILLTIGLEPNNSGLYFQADNDLSPGIVWGDGLRCAGGALKRLGVRVSDAGGYSNTAAWTTPISVRAGNISPGDTKYYQCWYRTTDNPPCGPGVHDFNASNGYAVQWGP